ncbi:MAG: hypothetical protein EXX96DRAFT_654727 [Benjaminiella poitrasii]|nr:MAG: hypothetical protein EXX96DRAFT_654727 [Benjaminiella poitrasii]
MSTYFFYENGQVKIYDKQGKDAMEWAQPSEQEWMRGELDEIMNELYKAAKAARLSGVAEHTGQQWAKRLRDEPKWDIFEKQTNKDK